jgi:anti-sigma factor RsiW
MKLTSDQLEALIVQAVDGTLGDLDRRALEERLAVDAEARLMLHEHQRLSDALRAMPMLEPMPAIDFNQLSSRISAAIEREPAFVSQPVRMTSIWIRRLSIAAGVAVLAAARRSGQRSQTGRSRRRRGDDGNHRPRAEH